MPQYLNRFIHAIKAGSQFIQNGWTCAENCVNLDQLLVRGSQPANALQRESQFIKRTDALIKTKEVVPRIPWRRSEDDGKVALGTEVKHQGMATVMNNGGGEVGRRRGFADATLLTEKTMPMPHCSVLLVLRSLSDFIYKPPVFT